MNLKNITIEDIRKDIDVIKKCIIAGKWCSPWASRYFKYPDLFIDSIDFMQNDEYYAGYYGCNDVYINIKIYTDKLDNEKCFSNGYLYTSNRVIKLSDIVLCKRYYKIEQLKEKLCQ